METCVSGWVRQVGFAAERYQIILCAPMHLAYQTEMEIRALLRPWDRLEKRDVAHDVYFLVAAAAKMA